MPSTWLVPDGLDGERLDVAAARMTGLSRNRIEALIVAQAVSLNSGVVLKSARVYAGDLLEVELSEASNTVEVVPAQVEGIEIIYDDADIVVVDKPAGIAAHPSLGWEGGSVVEHLAGAGFRISTSGAVERQGIVQRLDVGTSGLMVVAKSEIAYSTLKRAFKSRAVEKNYQTLVQGHPDPFAGSIDAPIGRKKGAEYKMAVVAGGRHAVTHYETLEAFRSTTWLQIELETGRTHQIRVHMQAIKHPVVGDPVYGSDPVLSAKLGLDRQWLHATRLAFMHPTRNEAVEFHSQLPADLNAALEIVRGSAFTR
ncbi:MAG: RluA family pseudouridine synthase [Propionibacteriaceae bacterium]|nr:RluA family pseudouridine synthase [Propionibacteriaceae bacterium]